MPNFFEPLARLSIAEFTLFPYGYLVLATLGAGFFLFAILLHSVLTKKKFLQILGKQTVPVFVTCVYSTLLFPFFCIFFTQQPLQPILTNSSFISLFICSLAVSTLFLYTAMRINKGNKYSLAQPILFLFLAFSLAGILFFSLTFILFTFFPNGTDGAVAYTTVFSQFFFFHTATSQPIIDLVFAALDFFLMAFLLCTSISQIWLVLRRHADDFGRDYYAYSLRVTSAYGSVGACILVLVDLIHLSFGEGVVAYFSQPHTPVFLLSNSVFFVFLAGIFWSISTLSKNTLRTKAFPLTANLFILWAIFMQLVLSLS